MVGGFHKLPSGVCVEGLRRTQPRQGVQLMAPGVTRRGSSQIAVV